MDASQIRRKGSTDFVAYYDSLCALQNTCPVASIRGCAEEGVLNCNVYKLKKCDWHPILSALRVNTVLHTIVFHEKWEERALQQFRDILAQIRLPLRSIVKFSQADKELTYEITRSLHPFLGISSSVSSLVCEGLQISLRDIKLLAKGLKRNTSLKHLSLKGSFIGDKSLSVLCQVLKTCNHLEWLDLTSCALSSVGITSLVTVIQHQSLYRQSSVWKDSLRGQCPQRSSLSGLRRVTLSINPDIKDGGAYQLAEILRDDLWIKALDLQTCQLTTDSARKFQEILKTNTTLMVLDLRENDLIDDDILDDITEQLMMNVTRIGPSEDTYRWLDVEITRIKHELKTAGIPVYKRRRRLFKPAACIPNRKANKSQTTVYWSKRIKGMPWRTAARSSQRWRSLIPDYSATIPSTPQPIPTTRGSLCPKSSKYGHDSPSIPTITSSTPTLLTDHSNVRVSPSVCSTSSPCTHDSRVDPGQKDPSSINVTLSLDQFRQLQDEVATCHQRLKEEEDKRRKMELKLTKLESEKMHLKQKLIELERTTHVERVQDDLKTKSPVLDEQTLESIETTFKQFHAFLDLLNEKGYGHLTSLLECT